MKTKLVFGLWLVGLATAAHAQLFSDDFARGSDPVGLTAPWATNSGYPGVWTVTGGVLRGGPNAGVNYGIAYVATNAWTNYSVSAKIQFSGSNSYGGGIGGRLDSNSGSRYAAWVFPEFSTAGISNVVKLIKFSTYGAFTFLTANLPVAGVGTSQHTVRLDFTTNQIGVYYDGNLLTNYTDAVSPYLSGGISVDMWSDPASYTMSVDDVLVSAISSVPVANDDGYNSVIGTTLTVTAPGVLSNDTGGSGPLTAVLVASPARGNFNFNANGSFTYTATNGYTGPDSFTYYATDGVTNSAIATVSITVTTNTPPAASADIYAFPANLASAISSPGVLANDTDVNGNSLTAVLVSNPTNGTLSFNANGGFTYTPNNGYLGPDAFTYRANDGLSNSPVALVSITVLIPGQLYTDGFARGTDPAALTFPWATNNGAWAVTGGVLQGGTNATFEYGYAYIANVWSNYSVSAKIRFSNSNAWGGGIGGRLADSSPTGGAHYGAWLYPDASAGGSNVLVLIKFTTWTSFSTLASIPVGSVGTNFHTIKLAFAANRIAVTYDGVLQTNVVDASSPIMAGGISADMWTGTIPYSMSVDDVAINLMAVDDYYNAVEDTTLTVGAASGILTNDAGLSGGALTAALVSGPAHGTLLSLGADGSFSYLAATNYVGTDSFTYEAIDGTTSLGNAIVNFTVAADSPIQRIFSENFDGVTAPVLPVGWTTSSTGGQSNWVTQTVTNDTPPNAAFSPDPNTIGINELISPVIALPAGQTRLAFRNNYNLEVASATFGYDGAVLEIKIGAGAFADILTAGGSFVSGGYNRVITNSFGNALSNRPAWSGNSGGFISTLVNLPAAAAGQSIQLRWRCGTDNGTSAPGWRIDTISITNCSSSGCWNTPPLFAAQSNRTIVELSTLSVTNPATDFNLPPNSVSYSLVSPPTGATINTNTAVIAWTPTEAQGPGTYTFRTRALDNGSPPLSSTNVFTVTVTETNNNAPVLPTQTNRTIVEATLMTVTNRATDADVPANTLTYSFLAAPTGAVISSAGVITWTPNDSQGDTTNTFTTRVVDNVAPTLSATNTFMVIVLDTNNVPVLPVQTNRTIAELTTLTMTNTATDPDMPTNSLVYSLLVSPPTATISPGGVIIWTPGEEAGPSTNVFMTRVVDDGSPALSATNTFNVVVTEVNTAPVLPVVTNVSISELTTLVVTNMASDADIPANVLTYTLIGPPDATITNGVITWTPGEADGPSTNIFTTVVSDGTVNVTNQFVVTVGEVNLAPVFVSAPDNITIAELTPLAVTNNATDADLPANTLVYSLENPPDGASISTNGVITWTPTEAQGPGTNTITTIVSDGTLSVTNSFEVIVTEVNIAPVLQIIADHLVHAGGVLSFQCVANDPDGIANNLSFSLGGVPPPGATINPTNGIFVFTTTDSDANTTNLISVQVVDDGLPPLGDTKSFTVTVVPRPLIASVVVANHLVTVTWTSIAGQSYRLQNTDALTVPVWEDVDGDVIASGSTASQTNSMSGTMQRFYRVRLAP